MSQYNFPIGASAETLAAPATRTTTLTGTGVDLLPYIGPVAIILTSAAGTGTNPTLSGKIQDSADNSTDWQDVTGATFTQVTNAAASTQAISVNSDQVRRYIRFVGTVGGTPSFVYGVVAVGVKQII